MRDVAREASVAIGTLYRYVGSKDELLLICLERYIELARELVASEPNKTDTLESIERRLRDSAGLLSESPNLCSAFVTALVSTDPATASVKDRISEATAPLLADALGTTDPAAIRILGHVFYSALVRSVGGENIDIGDEVAAVAVALNLGSD
jgi:AcrR family transcriptional regulator